MIDFHCSKCGAAVHAPDSYAGKQARCASCKIILTIPASSPPAAPASANAIPGLTADLRVPAPVPLAPVELKSRRTKTYAESALLVLWRRYWIPALVLLVFVAVGAAVVHYLLRDTWEPENLSALKQRYAQATELRAAGRYVPAAREYQGILVLIGQRQLQDPELRQIQESARGGAREVLDLQVRLFQTTAAALPTGPWQARLTRSADLIGEMAATRAVLGSEQIRAVDALHQSLDRDTLATLRQGQSEADGLRASNPPVALQMYEALLAEATRLRPTLPEVQPLIEQVTPPRDRLAQEQRIHREYLGSIDPFLQETIPFLRRLRYGMPERMYMDRAAKIIAAWRAIKDPPDRTTAGELLSRTNDLAADMALLQQTIEDRQRALQAESIAQQFKPLKPAEIPDEKWNQQLNKYVTPVQKLVYIGRTVNCSSEQIAANIERVKRLEQAFRGVYQAKLGTAYAGEWSMIVDKLDPAKRRAFLDSFTPYLEITLPLLRRTEQGIERSLLLTRLAEVDEQYGRVADPPDDSDLGLQMGTLNALCEKVYEYGLKQRGQSAMDLVGQGDSAAKEINDGLEKFQADLRDARTHTTPDDAIQAYSAEKKRWLDAHPPARP